MKGKLVICNSLTFVRLATWMPLILVFERKVFLIELLMWFILRLFSYNFIIFWLKNFFSLSICKKNNCSLKNMKLDTGKCWNMESEGKSLKCEELKRQKAQDNVKMNYKNQKYKLFRLFFFSIEMRIFTLKS